MKTQYLCPARKCDWSYLEPEYTDDEKRAMLYAKGTIQAAAMELSRQRYAATEKILQSHIATHVWWRVPRSIRKALKRGGEQE